MLLTWTTADKHFFNCRNIANVIIFFKTKNYLQWPKTANFFFLKEIHKYGELKKKNLNNQSLSLSPSLFKIKKYNFFPNVFKIWKIFKKQSQSNLITYVLIEPEVKYHKVEQSGKQD